MESNNNASKDDKKKRPNCTYKAERVIGKGSFGIVFQAYEVYSDEEEGSDIDIESKERLAIKKVFQDKRYKNRELATLKQLYHPNIITFKTAFYTRGEGKAVYLNLVMEYVSENIFRILKHYNKLK